MISNIPSSLIEAIKEQRTILFLGAGASQDAIHSTGQQIPQGDELRDLICDKFLGSELKHRPLNVVAGVAASEAGLITFQRYIRQLFLGFEPAPNHLRIPLFRWRAIVTTNFDLIVERAYDRCPNRLQNLVKTVKDGDSFDTRLNEETDPVGYYKLHGCIDHHTDAEIPLVLSNEQYVNFKANRSRFYNRFRDLGHEYSIIFAGYSISDSHIQTILFNLTDPAVARPPFYLISPGITDAEARYWGRHRVDAIDLTFEHFLESLDKSVPTRTRAVSVMIGGGTLSIRKHYRIAQAIEPSFLASYIETDVTHIYSGLVATRQDPVQFYRGYDNGWGCVCQNLDAVRSVTDSVLVDAVLLSDENRRIAELFMLKGPAGNGKTVSLKRIAWESAARYEKLVLYADSSAGLRIEPLAEIYRLTGKRIFLFIDHVALFRNELRTLLKGARSQSIPISVVGAERDNEWNIYCEHLEPFVQQEFPVRYLSEPEIRNLLTLLEQHNALGLLESCSHEDRVHAFTEKAGRQLLVALHEATLGLPFEEIVLDEFKRIQPSAARNIYLDICALHQFGAPVRAGLISRTSGVSFERFGVEFIQPLENVVRVVEDRHNRDYYFECRHPHVAEIVFNRVLPEPNDKFDLLVELLGAINVDYSSDRATFSRMIKGRSIKNIFPNPELGRLFYDRVEKAVPRDSFVCHQRAVFEMVHSGGSLVLAERAAARAYELNRNSRSIRHTQAEIARRRGNETDDPLRKISLRRVAREKLGHDRSESSEYDHYTYLQLAIDELKELSASFNIGDDKKPPKAFFNAVKDVELALQRGLQRFPENPQLLAAEATFRDHLNQAERAQQALERAFRSNPRQDWLAIRLARKFQAADDLSGAKRVLMTCLRENPASKLAHMELGRILIASGNGAMAIEHLKRGFTEGDNNHEAQFLYARGLFLLDRFAEAKKLFGTINDRAPGKFRKFAGWEVKQDGELVRYDCSVERKEEGYAFLRLPEIPMDVFASRASSDAADWRALHRGVRGTCGLAFNRRGVCAVSVQRRRQ